LRVRLTDKLRADGGHCGYGIAPSKRGKGYGTLLVKTMAGEAAGIGLDKILLTIYNDNVHSIKAAINSGGVVEKVADNKHYIWLECTPSRVGVD
jgi:predicted acetyltransferase